MLPMLLLSTALSPAILQDPAPPEKVAESFLGTWMGIRESDFGWDKIVAEADALGDFCRTEESKARWARRAEDSEKWREEVRILSSRNQIIRKAEGANGGVTVDALRKLRRKRKDYETGQIGEVGETSLYRLNLVQVGDRWLVQEVRRECYSCQGAGYCWQCKGTGQAHERTCFSCGGDKNCRDCRGEKLKAEDLIDFRYRFLIAENEPTFSADLSTPKSSAQAYSDFLVRKDLVLSQKARTWIEAWVEEFRSHVVPDVVKVVEQNLERDLQEGKLLFAERKHCVESVDEKGEEAFAILLTEWEGGDGRGRRLRLLLKKSGDRWLVDATQDACWSCQGEGKCRVCQGTGKSGNLDCYGCDGKKICLSCEGKGWRD